MTPNALKCILYYPKSIYNLQKNSCTDHRSQWRESNTPCRSKRGSTVWYSSSRIIQIGHFVSWFNQQLRSIVLYLLRDTLYASSPCGGAIFCNREKWRNKRFRISWSRCLSLWPQENHEPGDGTALKNGTTGDLPSGLSCGDARFKKYVVLWKKFRESGSRLAAGPTLWRSMYVNVHHFYRMRMECIGVGMHQSPIHGLTTPNAALKLPTRRATRTH
jgi:hypothetical protein